MTEFTPTGMSLEQQQAERFRMEQRRSFKQMCAMQCAAAIMAGERRDDADERTAPRQLAKEVALVAEALACELCDE